MHGLAGKERSLAPLSLSTGKVKHFLISIYPANVNCEGEGEKELQQTFSHISLLIIYFFVSQNQLAKSAKLFIYWPSYGNRNKSVVKFRRESGYQEEYLNIMHIRRVEC